MNRKIVFLYFISILTLFGCSSTKKYSYFENKNSKIEKIAVLPFEIILTGKIPKEDQEKFDKMELEESIAFQNSFSKILVSQNPENNLAIQSTQKTVDILNSKNVGIKESWKMHPQKLAKILGVDAVVKSRIKRKVDIPNKKALRRNTAIKVLNISGIFAGPPVTKAQDPNAQNIKADYVLVESRKGDIVWKKSTLWNGNKNIVLPEKADLVNQNSYFLFP